MSLRTARTDAIPGRGAGRARPLLVATILIVGMACTPVLDLLGLGRTSWLAVGATTVALGALVVFVVPGSWRGIVLGALACAIGVGVALGTASAFTYASPVLTNLALAGVFGATLARGREPLISRFARTERGTLEADLARYTRRLTWVWTLFFVAMAFTSMVLALRSAVASAWFTLIGNWICVAVLFVGEYAYRRLRFRHYVHVPPWRLASVVRTTWRQRN